MLLFHTTQDDGGTLRVEFHRAFASTPYWRVILNTQNSWYSVEGDTMELAFQALDRKMDR